jgi:hypothetical protein
MDYSYDWNWNRKPDINTDIAASGWNKIKLCEQKYICYAKLIDTA